MMNRAFDDVGATPGDCYPEPLRAEIDVLNDRTYDTVNNGVCKAGSATTQEAQEEAVVTLFDTLDWLEDPRSAQRDLTGDALTEADWRLLATHAQFGQVCVGHFKCNLRRMADCPNLVGYVCDLYQHTGIAGKVDLPSVSKHYYGSHTSVNPTRLVPMGPEIDCTAPQHRARQNNTLAQAGT